MIKNKKLLKYSSRWSLKKPLYVDKSDKRYKCHIKQLKENGFSDAETWALDSVVAEFILPRLKRFHEITISYPNDIAFKEWKNILNKIIFAFEWSLTCKESNNLNLSKEKEKINWEKYNEGMQLFSKYFRDLWW